MRPRGFIDDWRPYQKSLDLLVQVEAIIAQYQMALTIRQIFLSVGGALPLRKDRERLQKSR
jgi:hypothetical protein